MKGTPELGSEGGDDIAGVVVAQHRDEGPQIL